MEVTNRADNERELLDFIFFFFSHTFPAPDETPLTHCLRGNCDRRDGHTVYNPAPHLGYELAYQGLSALVMGLMTTPHLGSGLFNLRVFAALSQRKTAGKTHISIKL